MGIFEYVVWIVCFQCVYVCIYIYIHTYNIHTYTHIHVYVCVSALERGSIVPYLQVTLVVPWAVVRELDTLKGVDEAQRK